MNPQRGAERPGLEARLAGLRPGLDLLGLPACILDAERRYRYVNRAYAAHAGRPLDSFLDRDVDALFPRPSDARRAHLERALAGETVVYNRQNKQGPKVGQWVRAHYLPLVDEDDAVIGVLVMLIDVQQLKDAESALADRERQLSLITDAVGFPLTYVDLGGVIRFANGPSRMWAGRGGGEPAGRHLLEATHPAVAAALEPLLARALAGESVAYEREALWPGRGKRHVRCMLIPDRAADGAVRGALALLIDIEDDHRLRRALDDQRKQLQLVIDNIGVPMSYIDRDWRFRFANQPGFDWKVASPVEAIGRHVEEMFTPEVLAVVAPEIARALGGEKRTYERIANTAEGESRWVRVHLIPDFAADGSVAGLYTLMIDIDRDRRLHEALARQEAQLRSFAENIPGPIAVVDDDFRYVFANKVFQHLRGMGLDQLVGRRVREVMGAEAVEFFDPFVARLQRGETCTYERLVGPPGHEPRWHLVRLAPIMDGEGRFNGCYIVGSDIHDFKTAQERMRAQEAQLRLYTDNIPDAVAYLDHSRRVLFANRHFAEQRGTTPETIIGRTSADLLGAEVASWIAQRTQPVFDRGETVTYERESRTPQGERRWLHVKAVPDLDDERRVRGMYVVAHDISEAKEAQAAATRAHAEIEDKERQLRQVIDSIPTPMCYVDAANHYRYVNDAFLRYIGLPAARIVGRPVHEVLGDERWQLMAPILDRVRAGESLAVERLVKFADGASRWMTVRLTPRMADGRYHGYYATTSDIHEQKMVEQELRRAHSIVSAHFDNTPLAVIELDTDLRVVRWSGQAEAIFGWSAAETLGRQMTGWRHIYEDDEPAASAMIRGLAEGRERHATLLHRNYRKDGSVIWVEWHNSALRDEQGRVISILSLAQDVSSRIQAEERLQFMATHDGLTGLPNSVLLNDRLEAALARANRARRRVGVMFLDLDHFKDVNDTLGHRVGDALLKELARRIRGALRQSDLLARVSGDEFVVVLEDIQEDDAPEHVARKVLDEVRRAFKVEGNEIHVSASLGLALHPEDGSDAETLLKNADAAMYHAKELGRNGFRGFSAELAARRTHRVQLETALRRALRGNELILHYQPIMSLRSGEVHVAEALLRWQDPERGLVMPHGFIPLADESGLGHAVGSWVLENACRQARAWRDGGIASISVCVNLSAGQLRDGAIVGEIRRILERTGCSAAWLQLEITETSMVRDVEGASLVLARLRALGVRIAIDDFGTGFSSLSHLRHLPVDVLKIDKAFVADIDSRARPRGESAGGAAIVSAVIGLARGLGLDVIAEGVEKRSQLAFLEREGCSSCQGFLVCPPLPVPEFEAWMQRHQRRAARKPGRARPRAKRRTATS